MLVEARRQRERAVVEAEKAVKAQREAEEARADAEKARDEVKSKNREIQALIERQGIKKLPLPDAETSQPENNKELE